jgi:phenylacetate-CoA ligase
MEIIELNKSVSILVPCFNESGNIEALFNRIEKSLPNSNFEVIYVDDGSTDDTRLEIIETSNRNPGKVQVITHEMNLGIPSSWRSGLHLAKYELICLIDGDLQNPPEAIPGLILALDEFQCDVAQGTRSSIGRVKNSRLYLSKGLNFILNLAFRQVAQDSKSGFLVAKKYALADVLSDLTSFKNFQTFIGVAFRSRGYRVKEIETLFMSRELGSSFLTPTKTLRVLLSTFGDIVTGLRIYGRGRQADYFLPRVKSFKSSLPLFRKILFNLYFLTMPLHKWVISRNAKNLYLWLKGTEFATRSEIENLQLRRMQYLLQHAYTRVPYYKRVFENVGFNPSEFKNLSDLANIPLLSKADVRKNVYFSMFSENHNKAQMLKISTSGSTGEPFVCYADKFQLEMRFATTLRALEMSGWRFGDKQMRLWHQTLGMSKSQVLKEKLDSVFMRREFIPAFEMTEESLTRLIKLIERKKPVLIDGYAESLNFIATASTKRSKQTPKAVMSSAQQLTDVTRIQIEAQFGAKVLDKYGSREFSGIAYQCLDSKYHHVQDESYIVEILVDGRPARIGEVGEVVITDLNNFSMPMIRYRIGDLAVAVEQSECKCGRQLSQIGEITGRTQALISCINGVWLPGTFFAHFFKDFDFAVQRYQVFQETQDKFTLRIVPSSQLTHAVIERIINDLRLYTGQNQTIDIDLVEEIPLLKTGKRTPVISDVRIDFQQIDGSKIRLD